MAATLAGRALRANHESVPPGWELLPDGLRDAGYAAAAFVADPLLAVDAGRAGSFDTYEAARLTIWDAAAQTREALQRLGYLDP